MAAALDVIPAQKDSASYVPINFPPKGSPVNAAAEANSFVKKFSSALERSDIESLLQIIHPSCWWKDILALTWKYRTFHGHSSIRHALEQNLGTAQISNFAIENGKIPFLIDAVGLYQWIVIFATFDTKVGRGRSVIRLLLDGNEWKAHVIFTLMNELKGFEETVGIHRKKGVSHAEVIGRQSWFEKRHQDFEEQNPDVLIIGAGQGGLSVAASLGVLNVNALVIEKNENIGDNWRDRYKFLVLHDPVYISHLAYMPFPNSWPVYTPKDRMANWLEIYAKALDLRVWTKSVIQEATFNETSKNWTVKVMRGDGTMRILNPSHVILATGLHGLPHIPSINGIEDFQGTVYHSSQHVTGKAFAGKKAVVVGSANSAHDIAQDFYEQGADTTMVQRKSTCVVKVEYINDTVYKGVFDATGPPIAEADLLIHSIPFHCVENLHRSGMKHLELAHSELFKGLKKAGFEVDRGINDAGMFSQYLRRGGGYYLDIGCSQLIVEKKIQVRRGAVSHFYQNGVVLENGSKVEADVIVLATGYKNMKETARKIFGDKVADRCSKVWGVNEEGEVHGLWGRSGHPGFWFMAGNLMMTRFHSKNLALQIKAIQEGLLEY